MKKLWSSIKNIIYTYIVQYLLILIGIISYIALTKDVNIITNQDKLNTFTIIGSAISAIILSIYLYKKHRIKESIPNLKKIILMVLLGIGISLFYNMLTIKYQVNNIFNINKFILIPYIVIIAPIYEELIFRYVSLRIAKDNYKKLTAIIIISILFAIMHTDIFSIIYAFILGIILSYIYLKYKNIIYPIILHISANLMSIFITEFNLLALIISVIILLTTTIYIKKTSHI